MKRGNLGKFLLAATLVVGVAAAADKGKSNAPLTGADLEKSVRHEILMYPKYTLWDDIGFRVDNGRVTVTGAGNNALEKQVAGMRAAAAGLSLGPVINNLTVDNPPAKKS